MSDPLIGRRLGNFKIERSLGQGGMGQVYYGWDVKLERPVAIKLLPARYRQQPEQARRLVQEAQAVARWRHEHIVQVYYADEEADLTYFVMEFVDGHDLETILEDRQRKKERLPQAEVLRIGRAVAEALDYAHQKGVIHRDVKPGNVMLAQDGRIVLMDFGLAVSNGTAGPAVGSARYMAPEQAQNSALPQSDLYALAVMLYQMLTGQLPFDDPSATALLVQHATQTPPSPRSFNPQLNALAEAVLLKSLDKSPQARYQTGRELMDALGQALTGTAVSPTDDLLGQQLDEYRLEALLGQGGMARIYRGYDVRLKRHVAIKVIDAFLRSETEYRARFEREAQAIAQLEHPHIVRLYRYGEVAGLFYMAMQYVEGSDLRNRLNTYRRQGNWVPLEEVSRITSEICAALDHAHSKGIIHRDVKPSNILLDEAGHVFLGDFGLALLGDSRTQGQVFGSPLYIAPEQAISSASAGPKSDLYGVGVMLYEMLTGRLPFEGKDALQVAMQHMSEQPPSLRAVRPDLNPALEAVVTQALAKEPEKRFASGAALAQALASAITAVPVVETAVKPKRELPPIPAAVAVREAPPPVPPPPVSTGRKRWWGWRWLNLAVGGLVLVAILFALWPMITGGSNGATPTPIAAVVNTATPALLATATLSPTHTPIPPATATATLLPSDTPTALPTATPSHTPPPTQTATPTKTAVPTETAVPSPTPLVVQLRPADGMPMVQIPAGTFMMGAADDDPLAEEDEKPAHSVTLSTFYLDQYEVSTLQYALFLNELGSYVNTCNGYLCLSTQFETTDSHLAFTLNGEFTAESGFENYPINNVSWHGASAYCAWTGGRLPTEAEWEWAARGENGRIYPWGNEPPTEAVALFETNFDAFLPVNSLPDGSSPFTIYHMAGSVWEWVADAYDAAYYQTSPPENPTGPEAGIYEPERVLRGGGYDSPAEDLRVSNRQVGDARNILNIPNVGFRCAFTPDA